MAAAAGLCILAGPLQALEGVARVIDGGTLEIAGEPVRLRGIAAPRLERTCTMGGRRWSCGRGAAFALAGFIGRSWLRCREAGGREGELGSAVCFVGSKNVNAWLVREGWAFDAPRESGGAYREDEAGARRERKGLWSDRKVPVPDRQRPR